MKYVIIVFFVFGLKPDRFFAQADTLRLHQVQVIGSHNSYKQAIAPELFRFLEAHDTTGGIKSLQYEHIAVTEQLDMGLRNLELDIYIDDEGGKYAYPKGLELVGEQPPYDPEGKMKKPGFKMLHIPDIDFRSTYLTLADALNDLRTWSEEHPDHEPVFITLEAKDGRAGHFGTVPTPFTEKAFAKLDSVLLHDLGRDHLIVPDDVREGYDTLEEAVLDHGWPTLKAARGKFFFILDDKGKKRELYRKGYPSLKNRVLFICAEPGTPEAATMIINDPNDPRIGQLVQRGYIIRTRADANTKEARNNDYSGFEAAGRSGAQIITTDYYLPSGLFKSSYHIMFGGKKKYIRKNPVFIK